MSFSSLLPHQSINVLLLENVHPSADELFTSDRFRVDREKGSLKDDAFKKRIHDVHILGIRSKTHVSAEILAAAPHLLAVGCFCIGTNQVDLAMANGRGIPVFNAPFSNTRSVAELILSEVIALARQLGDRSREVHAGEWRKVSVGCFEVRGKTLGIVGYGHIGRQVGVLAESLGLRVIFYDVLNKLPMGNNRVARSLGDLLREADFVTLHVPATPQTEWMMGAAELSAMKKGSYLLNASRGSVVRIEALVDALKAGHIAGAAVDVYPEEPEGNTSDFVSALRGLPNVLLTPHIGGSTEEAQEAIGREVSSSLSKFIRAGATTGAVNFPHVELPSIPGGHRLINIHRNVPGVLRDINRIVSDLNANVRSQMLATDSDIGCLLMDLDKDVPEPVGRAIASLPTDIVTRIL